MCYPCSHCGACKVKLPEGACPFCGAALPADGGACPDCGAKMPALPGRSSADAGERKAVSGSAGERKAASGAAKRPRRE